MLSGQVLFVSRSHRKEEIRPKMEGCVMSYNTGILTADSDLEGSHIIRDCILWVFFLSFFTLLINLCLIYFLLLVSFCVFESLCYFYTSLSVCIII